MGEKNDPNQQHGMYSSSFTNNLMSDSSFLNDQSKSDSPMMQSTGSWVPSQSAFAEMETVQSEQVFPPASSSVYCQSMSLLQSPTVQSRSEGFAMNSPVFPHSNTQSPPIRVDSSPMGTFQSPAPLPNMQYLTDLQPVTPSRINDSPRKLCGDTTKDTPMPVSHIHATSRPRPPQVTPARSIPKNPSVFKSPPTPFRLVAPDGTEFRPIITNKGNGKISITYPLDMLASFRQDPSSVLSSSSAAPMDCFSQFLLHPVLHKVPEPSAKQEDDDAPSTSEVLPTTSETMSPVVPRNEPQKMMEEITETEVDEKEKDENEDEKEERRSVQNITKALNINCDIYKATRQRKKMKNHVHNKLPKEVQGLMGEANLCFARGQYDDALKMCMEIIRIAPWCPDPFETLSMIYEERGENIKALQYSLLAAHLQTGDVDLWLRLAENCEDAGLLMQAAHCYNKALKLKPDDYKLYWAAAVSQQQLGNIHQALVLFKSVVRLIPESEVAQRMALARDIARACHANDETALALEVMDEVASNHPDHVKYEDVNVMCELAITSKQYRKVFDVMVKHCQIEVQYESEMDTRDLTEETEASVDFTPTHVKIPDHLPIDLKCKCVLAAIPMKCFNIVKEIFHEICGMDASEYGDLQFDIAELLMEENLCTEAIFVLDILVSSKDYSLAAVWLKKGECHRALGQDIAEMNCFKEVVKKAPGHTKAYLALCIVLRKLRKYKEAIDVIQDAETYELEDDEQMLLNFEKFYVYYDWSSTSKKKSHEILCKAGDTALLLIANKIEAAFAPAKTVLVKKVRRSHKKFKGDIRVTRRVGKNYFKHKEKKSLAAKGNAMVRTIDDWWEFFLVLCEVLLKTERYIDAITIIDAALAYGYWYCDTDRRLRLERLACSLSMISGHYSLAYSFMRPWLLNRSSSNVLWNLFNQITVRSQDQRHHRFCLRSLVKEPDSIALAVLNGHNSLATGTYKHSLGEYIRAHKRMPTEPMFMLLIGVIYTHISSQRFTTHKNSLVVQGLAFLNKYMKHRECKQEVYYNFGRMFHELGLRHFAVHWYKKALETSPPLDTGLDESIIDLKHEIGYNLAIIYKKSGNHALAMKVLSKYCVI